MQDGVLEPTKKLYAHRKMHLKQSNVIVLVTFFISKENLDLFIGKYVLPLPHLKYQAELILHFLHFPFFAL
jgi:hypothetical protein